MNNANGLRLVGPVQDLESSAAALASSMTDRMYMLAALEKLRLGGDEGSEAVELVTQIPAVRMLKLAFKLFETVCEVREEDADTYLVRHFGAPLLRLTRFALDC